MDNEISQAKCLICNSSNSYKILSWEEYSICRCLTCKVIFTNPLPDSQFLKEYYQGFLFNIPKDSEIGKQIENRKKELKNLFSFGEDNLRNKKFLDYGGGTGSVYRAMNELGLETYYHDLDIEAREFVRQKHGLKDEFNVENIQNTKLKFDYILSDNVIEHVKEPIKFVGDLRNVLTKEGTLIIKTPHARNSEAYFYPLITVQSYLLRALRYNSFLKSLKSYFFRFWHCDPPRHLFGFSEMNLRLTAKMAGFKEDEIEILYYRLPLWKYSFTSMVFTFYDAKSYKAMFFRLLLIPIIPFELISKLIQFILCKINILTPGGIILKATSSD